MIRFNEYRAKTRSLNPQIYGVDFEKDLIEAGIRVQEETCCPEHYHSTQKEFNQEKVDSMSGSLPAFFISRDNMIIDGHHRWKAAMLNPNVTCEKVKRVNLNYNQVLDFIKGKPYVKYKTLDEKIIEKIERMIDEMERC